MTDKTIAIEILNQLGGRKFIMMTGAKNFGATERGMAFQIPTSNGIRGVRVYLNGMDLYDMEFLGREFEVVKEVKGVYFDMLQDIFSEQTGLFTHL